VRDLEIRNEKIVREIEKRVTDCELRVEQFSSLFLKLSNLPNPRTSDNPKEGFGM